MAKRTRKPRRTKAQRLAARRASMAAELVSFAECSVEILDVLIEAREEAIGEEDEVARDLRAWAVSLSARAKGGVGPVYGA